VEPCPESELLFFRGQEDERPIRYGFFPNIFEHRPVQVNGYPCYLICDHNGGESGGEFQMHLVWIDEDGKLEITSSKPIWGGFSHEIRDVNQDQKNEVLLDSNVGVGLAFKLPGEKEEPVVAAYTSFVSGPYREVLSFDGHRWKNVTFEKRYVGYFSAMFSATEKRMKTLAGKTLDGQDQGNHSKAVLEILQYYYYRAKSGSEKAALEKIRNAGIQVTMMVDTEKEKRKSYALEDLISANADRILHDESAL
jgi:hypothetical protein